MPPPPTAPAARSSNNQAQIDRQSTVPFHLKLFYRQNNYNSISDFPIPTAPQPASRPGVPKPLPHHLEIYTWHSCTLLELSQLISTALPHQFPSPAVGTRLCFRLIYPDTRGAAADGRGRYLSKELGSTILGSDLSLSALGGEKDESKGGNDGGRRAQQAASRQGYKDDAEKTLAEARFVIGDYVDCAICPPLDDGLVAPPISASSGGGSGGRPSVIGGGMRAFGPPSGNGGSNGSHGGRRGGHHGVLARRGNGIPSGDWKRGERLPVGQEDSRRGNAAGGGRDGGGWGRRRGPY